MKVLLINGSPHEHGCTRAALDEAARVLHECGVETELINAGRGQGGGKQLFHVKDLALLNI